MSGSIPQARSLPLLPRLYGFSAVSVRSVWMKSAPDQTGLEFIWKVCWEDGALCVIVGDWKSVFPGLVSLSPSYVLPERSCNGEQLLVIW